MEINFGIDYIMTGYKYRAFISYSHADRKVVEKLHRFLEHFQSPNSTPTNSFGRVFRDEDELSASQDLGATLRGALDESETLIIVCSRSSLESEWVKKEVRYFYSSKPAPRIFFLLLDREVTQISPEEILGRFVPENDSQKVEAPFCIDLLSEGRRKGFSRIMAGVLDVDFDVIWQRQKRQQRYLHSTKYRYAIPAIAAILSIIATFSSYFELVRRHSDLVAEVQRLKSPAQTHSDETSALFAAYITANVDGLIAFSMLLVCLIAVAGLLINFFLTEPGRVFGLKVAVMRAIAAAALVFFIPLLILSVMSQTVPPIWEMTVQNIIALFSLLGLIAFWYFLIFEVGGYLYGRLRVW